MRGGAQPGLGVRPPAAVAAVWFCCVMLCLNAVVGQEAEKHALVAYDFDGLGVETGPYTVMVFQDSQGSVALDSTYRHSGSRSVEILDVAGDGDFTELQGYFPLRSEGTLYFHFAMMTAEPTESLNVALAGESHFVLEADGIALWLGTRDGEFFHVSSGEAQPLFPVDAFTWYLVDVTYRVESGRYDLVIHREGVARPLVELEDQPNAVDRAGSTVYKFSFIGDPPGQDTSNVRFYVDDIFVGTDAEVEQDPFVAPGRRMLFIDLWNYYRRLESSRPGCITAIAPADFGILDYDLRQMIATDRIDHYSALADHRNESLQFREVPNEPLDTLLYAMQLWNVGCALPPVCEESPCPADLFLEAEQWVPQAKLYPMSRVLALATQGLWDDADELWLRIYPEWSEDPRFPGICAQLGTLAGDLAWAEEELDLVVDEESADPRHPLVQRLWSGAFSHELALELASAFPDTWRPLVRSALIAEHRYYVLLWQGALGEARDYAAKMEARSEVLGIPAGRWIERQADASFWAGDVTLARRDYERSLKGHPHPTSVYLKLSDVHFRLGDAERERHYREAIYGHLGTRE